MTAAGSTRRRSTVRLLPARATKYTTRVDFYLLILNWTHFGGMTHFRAVVGLDRRHLGFRRLRRSLTPGVVVPSFSVSPLVPKREDMQKSLSSSTLLGG